MTQWMQIKISFVVMKCRLGALRLQRMQVTKAESVMNYCATLYLHGHVRCSN
jgi:hypothetical protein